MITILKYITVCVLSGTAFISLAIYDLDRLIEYKAQCYSQGGKYLDFADTCIKGTIVELNR